MKRKTIVRMLVAACLTCAVAAATAVPARRGVWKTIVLADGTALRATLCGDEHAHYWLTEDGRRYTDAGTAFTETAAAQAAQAAQRAQKAQKAQNRRLRRVTAQAPRQAEYTGRKRGLIILVEFQDIHFSMDEPAALFSQIANTEGYAEGAFLGSVADYFKAQSGGLMEIAFDVAGPVEVSQESSYYGRNDRYGNDLHPDEMVAEACHLVDEQVDFSQYDWNGDGYVNQIFVLYAGHNESQGGGASTIWPHEARLSDFSAGVQELDGVNVDTYACSGELSGADGTEVDGIGTICHEFSHCLGFPDTYDVGYDGNYGMGRWDPMAAGSYNGDSFCPAGYTAYERMTAGWLVPVSLTADTQVEAMRPLGEGGGAYIIYNDGHPDEYYLLENRQQTGWDNELPGSGLLITHVDYDEAVWRNNIVNSIVDYSMYEGYEDYKNDHQRMTILHADNDDDSEYWDAIRQQYTQETEAADPFPQGGNDNLTNHSLPAALLWNANTDGHHYMNCAVTHIVQHDDGTLSFSFAPTSSQGDQEEKVLLHETFDQCNGTGGNDGRWSGSIATSTFMPDNEGWTATAKYGGNQCARFGTTSATGTVDSPMFDITDGAQLTLRAAPWSGDGNTLDVRLGDILLDTYTLKEGQWNELSVAIPAAPGRRACLSLIPDRRFFLDDIKVSVPPTTGIADASHAETAAPRVYSLHGVYMGSTLRGLPQGVYVIRDGSGKCRLVKN